MTDLIEAIDELRRATPANDPWDGRDFNSIPAPVDYAICTILNAVLSDDLVLQAERDKLQSELTAVLEREAASTARWEAKIEAVIAARDMLVLFWDKEKASAKAAWNTRADLPPTLAAALEVPEVAALVDAATEVGRISDRDHVAWHRLSAALAALKGGA